MRRLRSLNTLGEVTGVSWRRAMTAGFGGMLAAGLLVAAAGPAAAGKAPALAFSPAPYDFGQVTAGQTASQTITLANSGRSASGALTVTLPGSAEFTITADTCTGTSLGPGTSCTVTVQFAPTSPGTVTATLTASHKKSALATDTLSGTGVVPAHLYWTANNVGNIWEANPDGSNPQTIASGQNAPWGVAVSSSHLYWADSGAGTIMEANLDGSNPQAIDASQFFPTGVAVDSSHLYWSDGNGTIWVANPDGSNPQQLLVTGAGDFGGLAVGSGHLYWSQIGNSSSIWEANLDASNPHQIESANLPFGVAVDSSHLYWGNEDGTVWEANLDGTSPQTIVTGQQAVAGVAVDSSHLYWGNGDGTIWEANLDGSSPQQIEASQFFPAGVAVGPQ
jgi:Abnormal spindle-like microcephaly-assoc'd, ASPM-SPD-2-Hydin